MQEKDQITISKEEYEKLKQIEKDSQKEKTSTRNIYDRVDIPVKVLDYVIIFGVIGIALAILLGAIL